MKRRLFAVAIVAALVSLSSYCAILVTDNFQRANGDLGPNWTTFTGIDAPQSGIPQAIGGVQIVSNAFAPVNAHGGNAYAIWNKGTFGNNQFSSATITAIAPFTSTVAITAAVQAAGNTTYTYTLSTGAALIIPQEIIIAGMADAGNNGDFVTNALGAGTFTVANAGGVTHAGQTGTGTSPSDSNGALSVRASSDGMNAYWCYVGTNSSQGVFDSRVYDREIWKRVAGVDTFLLGSGQAAIPDSIGDTYSCSANGTIISIYKNGVALLTTTDASIASGTPGVWTWSEGGAQEYFQSAGLTRDVNATGNNGMRFTNFKAGDTAYIVNQLASDSFARANGGLGAPWVTVTSESAPTILSNLVVASNTTSANNGAFYNVSFPPDQCSQITVQALVLSSGFVGPRVRWSSSARTGYELLAEGPLGAGAGALILAKLIAGAQTNMLILSGQTITAGDTIRLCDVGNVVSAYQNGAPFFQAVDTSIAMGFPGLIVQVNATAANASLNNWVGYSAQAGSGGSVTAGPTKTAGPTVKQ